MLMASIAALALTGAPQVNDPSFDCRRASTPVERAVCADPALGRLDRRMAESYAALRRALPQEAREALRKDQRWFLGAQDEWLENSERGGFRHFADLGERLSGRVEFLRSIRTEAPDGLAGLWSNLAGSVEISPAGGDRVRVSIVAAQPVNGRWICEVEGIGRLSAGAVTITPEDDPDWRVRVVLRRGFIEVEETRIGGEAGARPYCGHNGHVDGAYLPSRAG